MSKPILCLDFDGVLHSYTSGWCGAHFIPDPPVPGAMDFLYSAIPLFDVQIYSSRSSQEGGIPAMRSWVEYWAKKQLTNEGPDYRANAIINALCYNRLAWPIKKPAAFLTIDDRAMTFTGIWPNPSQLLFFKPWNEK